MLLTVLQTAWIELPAWILLAFGFYLALRILRFPDLTVEAAFVAGGVGAAWGAEEFESSAAGVAMALLLGSTAGAVTGVLYSIHKTPLFKLLAGLLVLFGFYSINYRVLGLRTDVNFSTSKTFFNNLFDRESSWGLVSSRPLSTVLLYFVSIGIFIGVLLFLHTESGFVFRSLGYRPEILESCGRRPLIWLVGGLIGANSIVAVGGWVYATTNSNVSITEFGYVLHALAAVILGELLLRLITSRLGPGVQLRAVVAAPLVGAFMYSLIRSAVMYLVTQGTQGTGTTRREFWMPISQDLNLFFGLILFVVLLLVRLASVGRSDVGSAELDEI